MQHGIVEGESGIFPAPIARFMRGVGRVLSRKSPGDEKPDTMLDPKGSMDELPKFPERPDHVPPTGTATDATDVGDAGDAATDDDR
jgi:hypothetical protein